MEKYPCLEIDKAKLMHNAKYLKSVLESKGIDMYVVTKVFCANKEIVDTLIEAGITKFGDSRIENLKKIDNVPGTKLMLRIPMLSQVSDVIKYADISLNSELSVIRKLGEEAARQNKEHKIILMIDLGDLREGVWYEHAIKTAGEVLNIEGIELIGIGTNLTCYGGVIPDDENLGVLIRISEEICQKYGVEIKVISGGNSSSLYKVLDGTLSNKINMLRIGEALILGRETAYGKKIKGLYDDVFTVKAEIIELKKKPSVPKGKIGMDAFGNVPSFENKGDMQRAIIALGRQDVAIDGLVVKNSGVKIVGASSDHLILDLDDAKKEYQIGDIIEFNVNYEALLSLATSEYVAKYMR